MTRYLALFAVLGVVGCVPLSFLEKTDGETELVPSSPFGNGPQPVPTVKRHYPPGNSELALRVDYLGRKIVAANPELGVKPVFATIGSPQPEIFHHGVQVVYVTEGLVKQCKNEAELAAALCYELGEMVADREALASPAARKPEHRPPIEVPIGNAANFSGPDQTHLAELARYEKTRPRPNTRRLPRPDPRLLAQTYLEKAGYGKGELTKIETVLKAAEQNYTVEKQFKGIAPTTQWTP